MEMFRKRNRRKPTGPRIEWQAPELRRLGRATGALVAVGSLVLLLGLALDQPVRDIVIDGRFQRVTAVEIQQVAQAALVGGFVSANLDRIRIAVEALAWVDRARVQRLWPDGLRIEIVEQQAAARWSEDGLLNTRGELFATGVRHVPPELPHLDGPPGTEWQVAQRYLTIQGRLAGQGLSVAALRLDPRGAWELDLSSGMTVRLGRRQVDERMDRFVEIAAPVVIGRAAEVRYVDMRYSNGFSIGWRKSRTPARGAPAALARRYEQGVALDG
jgi:cell division protein FtsQ